MSRTNLASVELHMYLKILQVYIAVTQNIDYYLILKHIAGMLNNPMYYPEKFQVDCSKEFRENTKNVNRVNLVKKNVKMGSPP